MSSTQRNPQKSKIGVDFGPEDGVDLAWIFWGREKIVTKFVPVSGKIRDRIRAANERPPENALSTQGKGRMNKHFWEKIVHELLRR